jgi:nicotinate-nucleotide pyrophosphorylase
MATFSVQIRAVQHLTRDLIIEADSEADARAQAEARVELISWDTSEPEDIQIEAVNEVLS